MSFGPGCQLVFPIVVSLVRWTARTIPVESHIWTLDFSFLTPMSLVSLSHNPPWKFVSLVLCHPLKWGFSSISSVSCLFWRLVWSTTGLRILQRLMRASDALVRIYRSRAVRFQLLPISRSHRSDFDSIIDLVDSFDEHGYPPRFS